MPRIAGFRPTASHSSGSFIEATRSSATPTSIYSFGGVRDVARSCSSPASSTPRRSAISAFPSPRRRCLRAKSRARRRRSARDSPRGASVTALPSEVSPRSNCRIRSCRRPTWPQRRSRSSSSWAKTLTEVMVLRGGFGIDRRVDHAGGHLTLTRPIPRIRSAFDSHFRDLPGRRRPSLMRPTCTRDVPDHHPTSLGRALDPMVRVRNLPESPASGAPENEQGLLSTGCKHRGGCRRGCRRHSDLTRGFAPPKLIARAGCQRTATAPACRRGRWNNRRTRSVVVSGRHG